MVAIIAFHVQIQKVFFIPFRYNSHLHFFLNIPSFFHFFEYRLLTPGRSGNSFNSKEVEHLRNLNYVNTLYSIIR